jgi:uncharacterized RDD family membrane protein YckC
MDGRWFYQDGNSVVGPFGWSRLEALVDANIISSATRVWKEGTSEWREFSSAAAQDHALPLRPPLEPELEPQVFAPRIPDVELARIDAIERQASAPPPLPIVQSEAGPSVLSKGWISAPVAPWRRYFARMLDTTLHGVVGFILLGFLLFSFAPVSAQKFFDLFEGPSGRLVDIFLTTLISIPIGAILLGLSGSTLGKFIFGVRILNSHGLPIGVIAAVKREFHVWFSGLGAGIPFVGLFCAIAAKRRLEADGQTSWDRTGGRRALYRPVGLQQYVLYCFGAAAIAFVIAFVRQL